MRRVNPAYKSAPYKEIRVNPKTGKLKSYHKRKKVTYVNAPFEEVMVSFGKPIFKFKKPRRFVSIRGCLHQVEDSTEKLELRKCIKL